MSMTLGKIRYNSLRKRNWQTCDTNFQEKVNIAAEGP